MKKIILFLLVIITISEVQVKLAGCAQIVSPTGGLRDSIPPVLLTANPKQGTLNFTGNRITLSFDEYVIIEQLRENLLVSPTPKKDPYIDSKLKTVTIKLRDTLEPNTTYSINLGNAIRDLNENNPLKNFTYVFSTGNVIDSLEFSGKVELAETGTTDSTLLVLLYKNLEDSAVIKEKPKYIARLDAKGAFNFRNLASGIYKVYALLDGDGSKTYNSKSEMFAFADTLVTVDNKTSPVTLYAYVEKKPPATVTKTQQTQDKKLRYSTKITTEKQSILADLVVEFNKPIKNFNKTKILLTDTMNTVYNDTQVSIDSTGRKISITNTWIPGTDYRLIILKDIGGDSTGTPLTKSDTIRFKTKDETDYGSIKLTIKNYDKSKNPVLQVISGNEVINAYPLPAAIWSAPLFNPGEYEFRILYDENNNGVWDPGNYLPKKQPEKVYNVPQKINIKANWDNEIEINL
jgi:Bacterial Ig-like domain